METKHTPLPWAANIKDSGLYDKTDISHDSGFICRFDSSDEGYIGEFDDATIKANAEFIVRACNSHYDLLEALDEIVQWHKSLTEYQEPLLKRSFEEACSNWDVATNVKVLDMTKAINAIAKARGQS